MINPTTEEIREAAHKNSKSSRNYAERIATLDGFETGVQWLLSLQPAHPASMIDKLKEYLHNRTPEQIKADKELWKELEVHFAQPADPVQSATVTPFHAQMILNVRDALVVKDLYEAYHFLYKFADPEMCKIGGDEPWEELQLLAATEDHEKFIPDESPSPALPAEPVQSELTPAQRPKWQDTEWVDPEPKQSAKPGFVYTLELIRENSENAYYIRGVCDRELARYRLNEIPGQPAWMEERDEYREQIQSMMLSINVHPDCEDGSEFDDMAQTAQDLLDKYPDESPSPALQGWATDADMEKAYVGGWVDGSNDRDNDDWLKDYKASKLKK